MNTNTTIGHSNLKINRIGLGCMGMSEFYGSFDEQESIQTLHKAVELGVNFLDTADMYGSGANEELLGKAFQGRWDEVVLATKFGIMRGPKGEFLGMSGKPDYIRQAAEASLKRLGTEVIDLYYMHRKDPEVEIEEIVGAMAELVQQGKVKAVGLSEVDPETLRRAHAVHPISALQTEYSLWSRDPEQDLFATCQELGITFVAYSPLGRGFLRGAIQSRADLEPGDFRLNNPRFTDEAIQQNLKFVEVIEELAQSKGVTKAQMALAWILQQNNEITTIPGTRKIHRLEENLGALRVELSAADLAVIEENLPKETVGERY
ncbi:MAG TPA: aldo/keto reductase [Cytophagales bacterium]|nr:aldo/keto reductase [Cytophagales bacterium]